MGYFDGLVASAFKEEDGNFYVIDGTKPRRFHTREDYERARSRLKTIYVFGLPLCIALYPIGKYVGWVWAIAAGAVMLIWFLIFGRRMITANSVREDISDRVSERIERMQVGFSGDAAATNIPNALARSANLDHLEQLASLRDRGILTAAEFEQQKAQALTVPQPATSAPIAPTGGAGTAGKVMLVVVIGLAALAAWLLYNGLAETDSGQASEPLAPSSNVSSPHSVSSALLNPESAAPADNDAGPIEEEPVPIQQPGEAYADAAQDSDALGTPGRCRLRIGGREYIDGDCLIRLEPDGSFQVMAADQSYFAQVHRYKDTAEGFWNAEPHTTHAQAQLGVLIRKGACWVNHTTEICAWR